MFHSPEWLRALNHSYGYEPVVLTTTPLGKPLADGIVFCRVHSWLTGRRLVSLPFSDHCDPLVDTTDGLRHLLTALTLEIQAQRHSYMEFQSTDREAQDRLLLKSSDSCIG